MKITGSMTLQFIVGTQSQHQRDAWLKWNKQVNLQMFTAELDHSNHIFLGQLWARKSHENTLVAHSLHQQEQLKSWKKEHVMVSIRSLILKKSLLLVKHRLDMHWVYLGIMADYGDESNNQTMAWTPSLAIGQLLMLSLSWQWWGEAVVGSCPQHIRFLKSTVITCWLHCE